MAHILQFGSTFMVLFDSLSGMEPLANGKFYVDCSSIEEAVQVRANGGPFNCSCGAYCSGGAALRATDDACTKQELGE